MLSWLRSRKTKPRLRFLQRLNGAAIAAILSSTAVAGSAVVLSLAPSGDMPTLKIGTQTEKLPAPDLQALAAQYANERSITPASHNY